MNPQVRDLIEMLKAATPPDAPRLWQLSPAGARAQSDAFMAPLNAGGPTMVATRDFEIPGRRGAIPARLYVPRGVAATSPGLLYLHGGGFVICSPATHDRLSRELAAGLGARVVSLDYALAPERPYPAGLEDCVDGARWLQGHGRELGVDTRRLLIGGDSAGANFSAATILRLRDEGDGPIFRGALLIYGWFGGEDTPSMTAWGDRDLILSRPLIDWFMEQYRSGGLDLSDPYIAPLNADLTGFPPSILVAGTLDPLLSDSEMFAAELEKAGVPAELHVYKDGIHAFVQMPMLDMTADALAKLCAFGRRYTMEPPATGGAKGSAMLGNVVELSVVVHDLEAAVEKFTRFFGLKVHSRHESKEFGFKNAILPTGIGHIELMEPTDPGKAVGKFLAKHGEGVYLVGFEVDDIPGGVAHLKAQGVRVDHRRPDLAWVHPQETNGLFVEFRKRESYE